MTQPTDVTKGPVLGHFHGWRDLDLMLSRARLGRAAERGAHLIR
jgi:hypothetical protein